jgi:hypothetical protein
MQSVAEKPPKPERGKRGRPKTGRTPKYVVYARVEPVIGAALEAFVASQRFEPKVTAVIEKALTDLLAREGFWPWPPPDA